MSGDKVKESLWLDEQASPEEMLTSYPQLLARLFEPEISSRRVNPVLFRYPDHKRDELLAEGIHELRRLARLRYLWESA
jgi:hypothetical protein